MLLFLVREVLRLDSLNRLGAASLSDLAAREIIATANGFMAGDLDKVYGFRFARFEPHRRSSRDIEPHSVSLATIETERGGGLNKMIMAADLHRPIPKIRHFQFDRRPVRVQGNFTVQGLDYTGFRNERLRRKL